MLGWWIQELTILALAEWFTRPPREESYNFPTNYFTLSTPALCLSSLLRLLGLVFLVRLSLCVCAVRGGDEKEPFSAGVTLVRKAAAQEEGDKDDKKGGKSFLCSFCQPFFIYRPTVDAALSKVVEGWKFRGLGWSSRKSPIFLVMSHNHRLYVKGKNVYRYSPWHFIQCSLEAFYLIISLCSSKPWVFKTILSRNVKHILHRGPPTLHFELK